MRIIPAHAKINLALEVTGRRPDGYHDIASVLVTIDWHDLVGCGRRQSEGPALRVTGAHPEAVPAGEDNLAVHAARRAEAALGVALPGLWLDKSVPVAAGLGGGSADAAAILRLAAAADRRVEPATLMALAASLGSDVPALLAGGALLVHGRGERLQRLPAPTLHLVVAVAGASSTAASYAALRDDELGDGSRAERLATAIRSGAPVEAALLGSALEAAACRASSTLASALARLRTSVPEASWWLTGSGGAAFALAGDSATARGLAERARLAGFPARACRTVAEPAAPAFLQSPP